jgi:hypothetical protein
LIPLHGDAYLYHGELTLDSFVRLLFLLKAILLDALWFAPDQTQHFNVGHPAGSKTRRCVVPMAAIRGSVHQPSDVLCCCVYMAR